MIANIFKHWWINVVGLIGSIASVWGLIVTYQNLKAIESLELQFRTRVRTAQHLDRLKTHHKNLSEQVNRKAFAAIGETIAQMEAILQSIVASKLPPGLGTSVNSLLLVLHNNRDKQWNEDSLGEVTKALRQFSFVITSLEEHAKDQEWS